MNSLFTSLFPSSVMTSSLLVDLRRFSESSSRPIISWCLLLRESSGQILGWQRSILLSAAGSAFLTLEVCKNRKYCTNCIKCYVLMWKLLHSYASRLCRPKAIVLLRFKLIQFSSVGFPQLSYWIKTFILHWLCIKTPKRFLAFKFSWKLETFVHLNKVFKA